MRLTSVYKNYSSLLRTLDIPQALNAERANDCIDSFASMPKEVNSCEGVMDAGDHSRSREQRGPWYLGGCVEPRRRTGIFRLHAHLTAEGRKRSSWL